MTSIIELGKRFRVSKIRKMLRKVLPRSKEVKRQISKAKGVIDKYGKLKHLQTALAKFHYQT